MRTFMLIIIAVFLMCITLILQDGNVREKTMMEIRARAIIAGEAYQSGDRILYTNPTVEEIIEGQ